MTIDDILSKIVIAKKNNVNPNFDFDELYECLIEFKREEKLKQEIAKFTVHGTPTGKARPRVFNNKGITPEKTKEYERLVQSEYMAQVKHKRRVESNHCIELNITAFFEIPKSTPKLKRKAMLTGFIKPAKKPDVDNIYIKVGGIALVSAAVLGLLYKISNKDFV